MYVCTAVHMCFCLACVCSCVCVYRVLKSYGVVVCVRVCVYEVVLFVYLKFISVSVVL